MGVKAGCGRAGSRVIKGPLRSSQARPTVLLGPLTNNHPEKSRSLGVLRLDDANLFVCGDSWKNARGTGGCSCSVRYVGYIHIHTSTKSSTKKFLGVGIFFFTDE